MHVRKKARRKREAKGLSLSSPSLALSFMAGFRSN